MFLVITKIKPLSKESNNNKNMLKEPLIIKEIPLKNVKKINSKNNSN